uniref:Uncharacterized protein n=1 Tax=Romanomermis culicivorax TaxID=13658 RepID=A0A915IL87_ROMCU
ALPPFSAVNWDTPRSSCCSSALSRYRSTSLGHSCPNLNFGISPVNGSSSRTASCSSMVRENLQFIDGHLITLVPELCSTASDAIRKAWDVTLVFGYQPALFSIEKFIIGVCLIMICYCIVSSSSLTTQHDQAAVHDFELLFKLCFNIYRINCHFWRPFFRFVDNDGAGLTMHVTGRVGHMASRMAINVEDLSIIWYQ